MNASRWTASSFIVATVFSAVAVAAGASTFWPTYHDISFAIMVASTIVIGSTIGVLGAVFRWPSAVVAAATVGAYFLAGVPLAVPGQAIAGILPSTGGLADLVSGAALGWKQLVTISTPVGSYQALLVPAFLLVLLASVITPTLALRARRGEWAMLPSLVLFTAGILLGPQSVATGLPAALALLATGLVWLAWFRRLRRGAAVRALVRQSGLPPENAADRRRTTLRAVAGAAVVVVVGGAVGTAATVLVPPAGDRQVVRSALAQPFDARDYPSPLTGFRAYLEPTRADAPMLTVSGLAGERRIQLATLDSYDGVVYAAGSSTVPSASGTFTRVPGPIQQPDASGRALHLTVTVRGYSGVWLPGAGDAERIAFTGRNADALQNALYFNAVSGTAAVLPGLESGDRYRVDTRSGAQSTPAALATAVPGSATQPKVGVVPDGIDQLIQSASKPGRTAGERLSAALRLLKDKGYVSHGIGADEPTSRSGHSADRITQLLTDVPMLGDQEQYAATASLIARRIGFPARVVVGFVVPNGSSTGGSVTLTGADISAWIQVQTTQDGWVAVDPNPAIRPIPAAQPQDPKQVSRPQSAVQPPPETARPDTAEPPRSHVTRDPDADQNPVVVILLAAAKILGLLVLALALVAAPFLAVIAAKWRRRRARQRAPDATSRITGGWREFADSALDHGHRPPPSATRTEVAETVGGMRPLVLAAVTDRVVFAPVEPTDAEADAVWKTVDEIRDDLGTGLTRWQRLRAAVSLRSLGRTKRQTDAATDDTERKTR